MPRGGKREGSGRKKKPDYLKRQLISIRLPKWMIKQIKNKGQAGYEIERRLIEGDSLEVPVGYTRD